MTELERILKDTLITMERDLTASLEHHETRLVGQQTRLEAQALYIQELRQCINRTSRISTALATLERYTRELGTALVALERLVERRIERVRDREREKERERQRSRGMGMGR